MNVRPSMRFRHLPRIAVVSFALLLLASLAPAVRGQTPPPEEDTNAEQTTDEPAQDDAAENNETDGAAQDESGTAEEGETEDAPADAEGAEAGAAKENVPAEEKAEAEPVAEDQGDAAAKRAARKLQRPVRKGGKRPTPQSIKAAQEETRRARPSNEQEAQPEPETPDKPERQRRMIPPEVQNRLDDLKEKRQKRADGREEQVDEPDRTRRSRRSQPGGEPATQRPARRTPAQVPTDTAPELPIPGDVEATEAETELNIPPMADHVLAELRTYSFSIKDGTYEQLMEGVARETGLAVLGVTPKAGKVSFVTDEELTFNELLKRVRMLLFKYKPHEPYWLLRKETHLEIVRVTDYVRDMPQNRMFKSVEDFIAANLPDEELVLVLYTPKVGSVADLQPVRDFMPDYVRVTPLEGKNAVTIFALASDIKKYLDMKDFFDVSNEDPRKLEVIEVQYIAPSEAVAKLQQLMELGGGGATTRRAPSKAQPRDASPLITVEEPNVAILPDDAQGVILVRAMENKLAEIKLLLTIIDVDTATSYEPVIIPVKHVDPAQLVETIQNILAASDNTAAAGAAPAKPRRSAKQQRARGGRPAKSVSAVRASDVTLLTHPAIRAIIVVADESTVPVVRRLVESFDVAGAVRNVRVELAYRDATEMVETIQQMVGAAPAAKGRAAGEPSAIQLIPDPSGTAFWFTGPEEDLAMVREMVAVMDNPDELVSLHIVRLMNQTPSFVAGILQQYESGNQGKAAPATARRAGRRPARRTAQAAAATGASVAKFTPDDAEGRLYILCTEAEWEGYQPIIQDLENEVIPKEFVLVPVEHISPDDAIAKLTAMMSGAEGGDAIRYSSTDDGLLVMGATPSQIATMKSLLEQFDRPFEIEERIFEIKYANPAEISAAIQTLLAEETGAAPSRSRRQTRKTADAPVLAMATPQADLTVVEMGQRLIVRTTPQKMERVAELIAEFDVNENATEVRVYEDFPPGSDIDGIADTLSSMMAEAGGARPTPKAVATGAARGPRFIPQAAARKLVVIAEPRQFEEIEQLLTVLRHEVTSVPMMMEFVEVRYVEPIDVVEMVEPFLDLKIRQLKAIGELAEAVDEGVAAQPTRQARRSRSPKSPGASDKSYHIDVVPGRRRIMIAGPQAVIDEAKQLISSLDTPGQDPDQVEVVFIALKHADPVGVVETIDPLLAMKVDQLVEAGALAEKEEPATPQVRTRRPQPRGRSDRGSQRYHLVPDERNKRIAIAAPLPIIEDARILIAELDIPGSGDKPVFETVALHNAVPGDMVQAIRELMGGPSRRPRTVGNKPGVMPAVVEAGRFAIVEAPSGGAVVLQGLAEEVNQARDWIEQLDAMSVNTRVIRVYEIQHADIDKLVDLIVADIDVPPAQQTKAPARPRGRAPRGVLEPDPAEDEMFATTKTRSGADWYIQADLIDSTMVVSATPPKISRIDEIVARMDTVETAEQIEHKEVPKFIYNLKHASPSDASFALEGVLKALWQPSDKRPKVDYETSFGDVLIVQYPDRERFPEIEQYIVDYVDKPDPKKEQLVKKPVLVPAGISAKEAALWLAMNNPEIEIELIDITPQEDQTWGVPEVKPMMPAPAPRPCVLPRAFARTSAAILASVAAQVEDEEDPPAEEPPVDEELPPGEQAEPPSHGQRPADQAEPVEEEIVDDPVDAALQDLGQALYEDAPSRAKTESSDEEESERPRRRGGAEKLKVYYDNATGNLIVEGSAGVVEDIPPMFDDLREEIEKLNLPPDIRIYRLRYIDVYSAETIINEMFNATRSQQAAVQQAQQQAQQQARQAQQLAQRQRLQQKNQPQQGDEPQDPRAQRGQQAQQRAVPQLPPTMVRVFPNPRDRTLILRADTNQYPALLKLLATVDQPKPMNATHRVYQLKRLNAEEMEDLLTDWLGLDERPQRQESPNRAAARGRRGMPMPSPRTAPPGGLPQTITEETGAGELGIDPQDIKLTSNAENNTLIALAPEKALDYIGDLIAKLESYEVAEREWKNYTLTYADTEGVAEFLTERFGGESTGGTPAARRGGRPSPQVASSLKVPTFIAYPRLNTLTAQATDEQFEEIGKLIEELDKPAATEEFKSVTLKYADAKVVSDTLSAMFSEGGAPTRQRGAAAPKPSSGPTFIGEEGGKVVFYAAPEHQHDRILQVVDELEQQYKITKKVRVIVLDHAKPSTVAEAIESVYGGGSVRAARRGGASAAPAPANFSITASDASQRLFVMADDDLFAEIESLAKDLDESGGLPFDFKLFPLQYADARQIHGTMTSLVTDYVKQLPRETPMDPFSVEVNDEANTLIVLGSPLIFGFVEEALTKIDTPGNVTPPPGVLMVPLKSADATEVAQAITRLWATRGGAQNAGEIPPQAEANRALNMVVVRGTQKQLDEIKKDILEPLNEAEEQALLTQTIPLKHARAENVAELINRIFEDMKRATQNLRSGSPNAALETSVAVTPDVNTNTLIVRASADNMVMIKERIAELDTETVAKASATSTKVYPVGDADANAVANIIKEWARTRTPGGERGQQTPAPGDVVVAVAEPFTQTVVVTASEMNHGLIQEVFEELKDQSEANPMKVHLFNLVNTESEAVARTLGDIFVRTARQGGARTPSVSAVQGSKAVMVKCDDADFEDIKVLIEQLDREELVVGETVRVVTLQFTNAVEVQTAIQEYLQKPGGGGGGGRGGRGVELVGGTRISVLEQTNAVVISGQEERVARIESLVHDLDQAGEKGSVPQIIRLAHAEVAQVLPTLQETFGEQRGGGRRGQMQPVIAGNDMLNALIVRADPTDMAAIEATIKNLDTEEAAAGEMFKLVKVSAGINVVDLAERLETSINASAESRAPRGGRGDRQVPQVTITPDKTTSTLLVTGSPGLFSQVERLVAKYEELGPATGLAIRIVPLDKVPASDVERLIQQLKGESTSSTSRPSTSRSNRPSSRPRTTRP